MDLKEEVEEMIALRTNTAALYALNRFRRASNEQQWRREHLATGRRANRAADDAVAMNLSARAQNRLAGRRSAKINGEESLQMLAGFDRSTDNIVEALHRMRELAVQAQNETYGPRERAALDVEWNGLHATITQIAQTTSFNGFKGLLGSAQLTFQVGVGNRSSDRIGLTFDRSLVAGSAGLSLDRTLLLSSAATIAMDNVEPYDFVRGQTDELVIRVNGEPAQTIRFNPGPNSAGQVMGQINAVVPDLAFIQRGRVYLKAEGIGSNTSLRNGSRPTAPILRGSQQGQYDTRFGNNSFQLGMDGGGLQNISLPVGADITSQQVANAINGVFPGRASLVDAQPAGVIQSSQTGPFDIQAGVNDVLQFAVNGQNRSVVLQETGPLDGNNGQPFQIQAGINDTFRYQYAGNSRGFTLADGVYQASDIRDRINALDAGLASVTGGRLRLSPGAGSGLQIRNGNMNATLGFQDFSTARGAYTSSQVRNAINNVSPGLAAVRGGAVVLRPPGSGPSAQLRILNSNGAAGLGFNVGDSVRGSARVQISSSTSGRAGEIQIGNGTANNALGFGGGTTVNGVDNSSASPVLGIDYNEFKQGEDADVPDAIRQVSTALDSVLDLRSRLAGVQRRLEESVARIMRAAVDDTMGESRIMDADFAKETSALTKSSILAQSSMAILSHSVAHGRTAVNLLSRGAIRRGGQVDLSSAFRAAGEIRGWLGVS